LRRAALIVGGGLAAVALGRGIWRWWQLARERDDAGTEDDQNDEGSEGIVDLGGRRLDEAGVDRELEGYDMSKIYTLKLGGNNYRRVCASRRTCECSMLETSRTNDSRGVSRCCLNGSES